MSPQTKILAPPLYTIYILYIYVVTCAPPPQFLYVADPMPPCIATALAPWTELEILGRLSLLGVRYHTIWAAWPPNFRENQ